MEQSRLKFLSVSTIKDLSEEDIIAEPLNLTVSLRGLHEVKDTYQIFRLTGQLDSFSEPIVARVIGDKVKSGPSHVILDLTAIDFIDSSGLGALVKLAKQAQSDKGSLQVIPNARVTQTVKLVRLEKFLHLQETLDQAIAEVS